MGLLGTVVIGSLWSSAPTSWTAPSDCLITFVQITVDTTGGADGILATSLPGGSTALVQGLIFALNNAPTGTEPATASLQTAYPVLKGQKLFATGAVLFQYSTKSG